MKKLIASFVLTLLTIIIVSPVFPADEAATPLIILRAGDWAPYHFSDNGTLKGHLIEIIKQASEASGIPITINTIPNWNRCIELMKRGRADAIFPIFKTADREIYLNFYDTAILDTEQDFFFTAAQNPIGFSGDLKKLRGYIIGTVRGYSYGDAFNNADYLNKIPTINETSLITLLLTGNRYDLIIGDQKVLTTIAAEKGVLEKIKVTGPPVVEAPLYLGFSNRVTPRTAKQFADSIARVRQTFTYGR